MTSLINLALPLVLVRLLPPAEVGRYKIYFLYLGIVPLLFLGTGLNNGLSHWAGYADRRLRAFRISWTLLLGISALATSIGIVARDPIQRSLGWPTGDYEIFLFGAFFAILAQFFEEASVAGGAIWTGALFGSAFDFMRNGSILAVAVATQDVRAIFMTHAAASALKTGVGWALGYRAGFTRFSLEGELLGRVVRYAFPVSLSAALQIVTAFSDQLILSRLILPADFSFYSLGCLALPPLMIFEQSVNRVLIPELSLSFQKGDDISARAAMRKAIGDLAWLLIPASFGLSVFAEPIVRLLFTERFLPAAQYLRVFAAMYLMLAIPYDAVPRARGDGRWILRNLLVFAPISMATTIFMIRVLDLGPMGALISVLLVQGVMKSSALLGLRSRENWRLRDFLPISDLLAFFGLAGALSGLSLLARPLFTQPLAWFGVMGGLFAVVYLGATFRSRILARKTVEHPTGEPLRVMIITQTLGLGGLERMILNLAQGFKRDGKYEPIVFVYEHRSELRTLEPLFSELGIRVALEKKGRGLSLSTVWKMARLIRRERVRLLHSNDLNTLVYAVLANGACLGRVRIIHTQHSFVHLAQGPKQVWMERFFTFFADRITVVSEDLRKRYAEIGVKSADFEVIGNGVEFPEERASDLDALQRLRRELVDELPDAEVREALAARIGLPWVLCMARVHPGKGQDQVLGVWEALPQADREAATLIFLGHETRVDERGGLRGRIRESARARGTAIYAGSTIRPRKWLVASDIFISGSEFEGMPLGPIEAVGAGLATIVSDIPGHEILDDRALRFKLGDFAGGAEQLGRLIHAARERAVDLKVAQWSQAESWRERFGIAAMTAAYQRMYELTLSDARP